MNATILVADDDRLVSIAIETVLRGAGHAVLRVEDGGVAIGLLAPDGPRIDAAVVDLVMPRVDGVAVLDAAARLRPALPVVVTSGHGEAVLDERLAGRRPFGVLLKPWRPAELLGLLDAALGAAGH